ncbi:MAG: hypothetical protein QG674_21 [Patescibacteria group bacterium]|jgi:hypothetical protein|nr:hypothetical protein [Patescibacteria group bacterium]
MKKIKLFIYSILFSLAFFESTFASENFVITGPSKDIAVGESVTVNIFVSSTNQAINAISGSLNITGGASISSVSKQGTIIDFWTTEPSVFGNQVRFEGVVLNPGYQGSSGKIFSINLSAKKESVVTISFSDGSILANDGLGSNIIDSLASKTFRIVPGSPIKVDTIPGRPIATNTNTPEKIVALPVITEYSQLVDPESRAYLKGKGEPNALTKLVFKDVSLKSLGEQFVSSLQTKKKKPTEALVKNDASGVFQYLSADNLVAGAYNVTPYFVDEETQIQKPGFGVQVLVNNSKMVKWLVILINILALLIPVVSLGVIIYFIPWYSRLRMKILNHKIKLEDEKLNLSEKEIKQKEELLSKTS